MNTKPTDVRRPWVALALSFLSMGLGQIYCGQVSKGLFLYCVRFLVPVLAVAAAFLRPSFGVLVGLILAPSIGMLILYVYAAVDSFRRARRLGDTYTLRDYNRSPIYCLLIAVGLTCSIGAIAAVKEFVFEAFYIPAGSMTPSVLNGDRILVNKIARKATFPERGELVVFLAPADKSTRFVNRVIGLPGDTVEMRSGKVFVNGQQLKKERVPPEALSSIRNQLSGNVFDEHSSDNSYRVMLSDDAALSNAEKEYRNLALMTVPQGNVFVLGDNRDRSIDSRKFGFVPVGDIIGQVQYLYWPTETWSRFVAY